MNYNITPIIEGQASNFPLRPEAAPLDEVLAALKTRILVMERQGYWRDDRGQSVPLSEVQYLLTPDVPEEEEDEELRLTEYDDLTVTSGLTPEQKKEFGDFQTSEEARRSVSLYRS